MKKIALVIVLAFVAAACAANRGSAQPLILGALYPTGGGQGTGGLEEFHGVQLATEYANSRGGVNGRKIELRLQPADSSDQAARAVDALKDVPVILGSYGSTISRPAADAAAARGVMFWETGAVGLLAPQTSANDLVFRFPPTGASLGHAAVRFIDEVLLSRMGRDPKKLRFGVTYVDDVYGRAVGFGMLDAIREHKLRLADKYPYSLQTVNYRRLTRQIATDHIDVLLVSAYMDDAIALRREMVRQHVPLIASIGTSSSYCMHLFGQALGKDAVGLYASDKPDGDVVDPGKLSPEAGQALRWARATYVKRYGGHMTAAALTGFSGAWALFRYVLPRAAAFTPQAIARAARATLVPTGSLPNGSGLAFGPPGHPNAADNLRATSVIWEWVKVRTRAVVWPPEFATSAIVPLTPLR